MSIKLTAADKRYSLIRPVVVAPRIDILYMADNEDQFIDFINDIPKDERAVAVDLETRGTVASHPEFRIVGVGLAASIGSIYLDVSKMSRTQVRNVLEHIIHLPLIGHNIYFDASGFRAYGVPFENTNWLACTYVLYKQLASEGYLGQTWGLKSAMTEMLGWTNTNEDGIDKWLIASGYATGLSNKDDTAKKRLRKWKAKLGTKTPVRPNKGEMWRVPASRLGHYCALDCEATWLLFRDVLAPSLTRIPPQTWEMHTNGFVPLIGILIDNHFTGLTLDVDKLSAYNEELKSLIIEKKCAFRNHPLLSEHITQVEGHWLSEIPVPSQFCKDGRPSKVYANYLEKMEAIKRGALKDYTFNINGNEMRELLYKLVQYEVIKQHEGADAIGKIRILGGPTGTNVGAELEMTESGQLPMDESAFSQMGEIGKLLNELGTLEKLQGYVASGLGKTQECGDGLVHPQYRVYGTLTGRLAGGGDSEYKVNYQQLPSDRKYLECYVARPKYVLIQADLAALEPHVLAEISRDKTYMELYGPNAKSHDIYLFNGSKIGKFKDKILAAGYEPGNLEAIDRCKKECKAERTILKKVSLAKAYGAGAYKIWTGLKLDGIDITLREVEQIVEDFDGPNLYGGVKRFQYDLEREWRENKGWILGGLGTAVPVAEKLKKDLLNRNVQSTGHNILVLFLTCFLKPGLDRAKIDYRWYIPDLHDETIYEVLAEQAPLALKVHCKAVDELNQMLGGVTTLKMDPKIIHSLAERKDD